MPDDADVKIDELEQKGELHRRGMRRMEKQKRWLKCVMLNQCSWGTGRAFREERGAELDVFLWASSTD